MRCPISEHASLARDRTSAPLLPPSHRTHLFLAPFLSSIPYLVTISSSPALILLFLSCDLASLKHPLGRSLLSQLLVKKPPLATMLSYAPGLRHLAVPPTHPLRRPLPRLPTIPLPTTPPSSLPDPLSKIPHDFTFTTIALVLPLHWFPNTSTSIISSNVISLNGGYDLVQANVEFDADGKYTSPSTTTLHHLTRTLYSTTVSLLLHHDRRSPPLLHWDCSLPRSIPPITDLPLFSTLSA